MRAQAAYRFAKADVQHPAFAVVEVGAWRAGDAIAATQEKGPMDPVTSRWMAAAESGARSMLEALKWAGRIEGDWRVRVLSLDGHAAHTRDDAMRCAAGLATFKVVLPGDASRGPSMSKAKVGESAFDGQGTRREMPGGYRCSRR